MNHELRVVVVAFSMAVAACQGPPIAITSVASQSVNRSGFFGDSLG